MSAEPSLLVTPTDELEQVWPTLPFQAVKVSSLGKWKTAFQMTSMSVMLFCRKAGNLLGHENDKGERLPLPDSL